MELTEKILFAGLKLTAWVYLHNLLFKGEESAASWLDIAQIVVLMCVRILFSTNLRPIRIFMMVGVFYLFNCAKSKAKVRANLLETLFTYVVTTMMIAVCSFPASIILFALHIKGDIAKTVLTGVFLVPAWVLVYKRLGKKKVQFSGHDFHKEMFVTIVFLILMSINIVRKPLGDTENAFDLRLFAALVLVCCSVMAVQWLRREYTAAERERRSEREKRLALLELESKNHKQSKLVTRIQREYEALLEALERQPGGAGILAEELQAGLDGTLEAKREFERRAELAFLKAVRPETGIHGLNQDLADFAGEMGRHGIHFDCVIQASMARLLSLRAVTASELRQITANLLDNAIRAVDENDTPTCIVTYSFAECEGTMRLRVSDSGCYFSPAVLRRLGARGNTTHENGFGLENVLNVLADCDASFFIQEFVPPRPGGYTKSITIRFDGAAQLEVVSPREEVERYRIGIREALDREVQRTEEDLRVSNH